MGADSLTSLATNQICLPLSMSARELESEHMKIDLESKGFIQISALLPVIEGEHHRISHDEYQQLQKDNA